MNWQVGLYVAAVLIPLAAFVIEAVFIRFLGKFNAYIATAAIGTSFVLSLVGFVDYAVESRFFHRAHHGAALEPEQELARGKAAEGVAPKAAEAAAAKAETAHEAGQAHEAEHEQARGPIVWKASVDWVRIGKGTLAPAARSGENPPAKADLVIPLGVYIDSLAVIMFLMVTFIAMLIHIYSIGYMHGDIRFARFFTYLSLFCFSMLGLVASANVFMIFIFWELVGVCSYLLIGHWYEEKKNADAANKAFITNRVGDVGMLVGLGLLWTSLGTFDINTINRQLRDAKGELNTVKTADGGTIVELHDPETRAALVDEATGRPAQIAFWALTLAGLGVFAGCVGKSAQFPLHVWLPDAMAGPTPVSALIHAATMVAAGVYLVGRFFPLFTEDVLLYIAYTGGITLFIAASIAIVQTDYKKVLAYSTVSQLGFMMLGLGVGGWAAGLFHLLTHAFFKALLFLGAGSVYHSVHTYEMPYLGGLRKKMPITAGTMLVGTMAISGVPFFSGFYSKDAILAQAIHRVFQSPEHFMLLVLPCVGAVMTAFYMFRMWFLVFDGTPRGFPAHAQAHGHGHDDSHGHDHAHGNPYDHAHESEPIMTWPLIALAFFSIFVGWTWWVGLPVAEPVLEQMLAYGEPAGRVELGSEHWMALGGSLVIALLGIGLGILYYADPAWHPFVSMYRRDPKATAERFPGLHDFLVHKWYFDELYDAALVRPTLALGRLARDLDRWIIDGFIDGSARLTELLSRMEGLFDNLAVDGLVNLTARGVYIAGDWGRGLQTGRLRNYLMVLAVALVGLSAGVFAWVR
jgi:proton-translocating NADH-quinone oxidoreductase chain L